VATGDCLDIIDEIGEDSLPIGMQKQLGNEEKRIGELQPSTDGIGC
jgi:hypothetical protein